MSVKEDMAPSVCLPAARKLKQTERNLLAAMTGAPDALPVVALWRMVGVGPTHVRRHLRRLEADGLVKKERRLFGSESVPTFFWSIRQIEE
jgi:predicted ArsR family transcriptional regulator